MIDTLKIGGREYKIKMTWKVYRGLCEKLHEAIEDLKNPQEEVITEALDKKGRDIAKAILLCLAPTFLWFKPFLSYRGVLRKITPTELMDADRIMGELLKLEDREGKN